MRGLLVCATVFFVFFTQAQQSLIGNTDGQWLIYQKDAIIRLPRTIHYLGNFDEKGLAIYAEYDKFGVLDELGLIRCPAEFAELRSIGYGIFEGRSEKGLALVDLSQEVIFQNTMKRCLTLTPNWFLVEEDSSRFLLNTLSSLRLPLAESDSILRTGSNYVYVRLNMREALLDPKGDTLSLQGSRPLFDPNYLLINSNAIKRVVFRSKEIDLPVTAANLRVLGNHVTYSLDGRSFLLDGEMGEELWNVPFEKLLAFDRNFYMVERNNSWGLIRMDGSVFIQPSYSSIRMLNRLFVVGKQDGYGVLDEKGQQILPCIYSNIQCDDHFFHVTSLIGLKGLISRVSEDVICEPIYDVIKLEGRTVRAWTADRLRIIQLDEKHTIQSNLLLDNVVTVKTQRYASNDNRIDTRLYELGWFSEWLPKLDDQGYTVDEILKWGLLGVNDTVLIPARHNQPLYIQNADFSLLPRLRMKTVVYGVDQDVPSYSAVDWTSGKILDTDYIFSLDSTDLMSRNFVRFFGKKGLGVLHADSRIEWVDYIDPSDELRLRYCVSSCHTIRISKASATTSVGFPTWNQNDLAANSSEFTSRNQRSNFVEFPEARWNFMDTAGKKIFAEDFDFVKSYFQNTAIVKKNGRWGVVNADTLIIPPKFASISRIAECQDTVFLAKILPQGVRLLDSMMQEVGGITAHFFSSQKLSLVEANKAKMVLNEKHQPVSDSSSWQKVISENYVLSKHRKEFVLRDANGKLLCTLSLRPEAVLMDQYVLAESKGKWGLMDFFGDTLLPFVHKSIQEQGELILAIDEVNNRVYDAQLSEVVRAKGNRILIDKMSQNIAVFSDSKCVVFSPKGKVLKRFTDLVPSVFHDNWLVELGNPGKLVHLDLGEKDVGHIIHSCEPLDGHGFLLDDLKGRYYFYDSGFNLLFGELNLRKARNVGDGCITAYADHQSLLMTTDTVRFFGEGLRVSSMFNSGFLLVETGDEGFCYYNSALENPFQRGFHNAHPFLNGIASVEEGDGWTLIDQKGERKSLGSYAEIKPLGNNLFSTSKQALYGLFDGHGRQILPVEFQEIHWLAPNLIQGIREGSIAYFDKYGKPVTLNSLLPDLTLH